MVEVPRPDRRLRRSQGKSDPIDAEAAARTALAGTRCAEPKLNDGPVEAIRALHIAKKGATKARSAATASMKGLIVTAPQPVRDLFPPRPTPIQVVNIAARFRPDPTRLHDPIQATKLALKTIATRARALIEECRQLQRQLDALLHEIAPTTAGVFALGPDTAITLLIAIGDNPDRLRSEAAFARLCGVAPIPASSGRTNRHRLHRGGIVKPTPPCTWPRSSGSDTANEPRPTPNAARPKAGPNPRLSVASSATWRVKCSGLCEPTTP